MGTVQLLTWSSAFDIVNLRPLGGADAMKNVNTINYEELSKDQIEAARKRRLRER